MKYKIGRYNNITNRFEYLRNSNNEYLIFDDIVMAHSHLFNNYPQDLGQRLFVLEPVANEGIELISLERSRHFEKGYDSYNDDLYSNRELEKAAVAYIFRKNRYWPENWKDEAFKLSDNHIRDLEKAGALIAAEIDRLQRLEQ